MACCIWSLNTGLTVCILSFSSSMNDRVRNTSADHHGKLTSKSETAHVRHIDAASLEIICERFTPVKIMIKEI